MHSEDLADQERSVARYRELGLAEQLDFAIRHRDIVARFGRFPHRNAVLGRQSTAEERAFLQQPGSSFRSEEHTSELQSLMRISYAVFSLKTKTQNNTKHN